MSGITSLAGAFRGGLKGRSARVYLIPINNFEEDKILVGERRSFQVFPESFNDSKAANYQTKVIPGLSHPLYQWTSSGGREVSFEAIFTRDRGLSSSQRSSISLAARNDLGIVADKFAREDAQKSIAKIGDNKDTRNVDIPSAIAWLRSFMYPEYKYDGKQYQSDVPNRPRPPRKVILGIPGSRINWGVATLPPSEMYCIMQACDVNYSAFFSDGTPRMARVTLMFAEIIQHNGGVHVHDAADRREVGNQGYRLGDLGLGSGR